MDRAESSNNYMQLSWIYSNIADFYGHDGQIEKSKSYYLKTLALDNSNWYAVNKLAWMAWSKDKNAKLALTMIKDIQLFNSSPSLDILKADILRYEGNIAEAGQLEDKIAKAVSHEDYGFMYTAFLNNQLLKKGEFEQAVKLSGEEIIRRPSVESYVLLMNCFYAMGDLAFAKKIAYTHLIGKTSEPPILIDVQRVLGKEDQTKKEILDELKDCAFELGPLRYSEIKRTIS
jgi:tetratricopeptide (TPR) repeat protein